MGLISKPLYYTLLFAIPAAPWILTLIVCAIHFKPKSWEEQIKSDRFQQANCSHCETEKMGHDADSKLHYQRFMHDLPTKYGFTHPQGHGGQQWPPLHQPMYPPMYSRRGGRRQQHHYDEDSDSDSGYDSPGRKKPSKSKKSKHGPSAAKEEVPHFIGRPDSIAGGIVPFLEKLHAGIPEDNPHHGPLKAAHAAVAAFHAKPY